MLPGSTDFTTVPGCLKSDDTDSGTSVNYDYMIIYDRHLNFRRAAIVVFFVSLYIANVNKVQMNKKSS